MGKFNNSKAVGLVLAVVASVAAGSAARGDLITLTPSSDAMIFGTSAGNDTGFASGAGPAFVAGADGQGNIKRSLIEFDTSSVPSDAVITGVTMTLYLAQIAGSAGSTAPVTNGLDRQFGLYDLLQPWSQGTSGSGTSNVGGSGQGFSRVNGDVTWDYASYNSNSSLAVLWNNSGTPLHGGHFSSTESDQLDVPVGAMLTANEAFSWSSAGMVADVQGWVDGTENDGWMLKSDNLETTRTSFLGFWSKDGAAITNSPSFIPTLAITFTVPAPEPGSLALFGVAMPWLLARRRHHRISRVA